MDQPFSNLSTSYSPAFGERRLRTSTAEPSATDTGAQRKPSNRNEFDGPCQLLHLSQPKTDLPLPILPISLNPQEQQAVLDRLDEILAGCAFDFIAEHQFPVPLEQGRKVVVTSQDRTWREWAYLLKRLCTKRRIPAHVLYNRQVQCLVTILENSLDPFHRHKCESRDDRSILQYISAGTQVAKILKDRAAMLDLDRLYTETAGSIQARQLTGLPI